MQWCYFLRGGCQRPDAALRPSGCGLGRRALGLVAQDFGGAAVRRLAAALEQHGSRRGLTIIALRIRASAYGISVNSLRERLLTLSVS